MKRDRLKKAIVGVLGAATILGALSGCSNSQKPAETTTAKASEESKKEETNSVAAQSGSETTATAEPVTIYAATGGSPKPFTFVDSTNQLTGHNIELIKAIFDRLPQYKLEIEVTDFPSIFAGLDSDRYQIGVNNFAKNEKRKEKYLFTDPIFANEYVAIFAKDNKKAESINTWEDLSGLKTISQSGINITTALETTMQQILRKPLTSSIATRIWFFRFRMWKLENMILY